MPSGRAIPSAAIVLLLAHCGPSERPPQDKTVGTKIDDAPRPPAEIAAPDPVAPGDVTGILGALWKWDAAKPESRRRAAEAAASKLSDDGWSLSKLDTFSCGGQTHEIAVFVHAKTGLEFSLVPAGIFRMGSPTMEPGRGGEAQHERGIPDPFLICRTECPQDAWRLAMATAPSKFPGARNPVENVSWDEARAFCRKFPEMDLPTEGQWEWACRAGTTTAYSCGADVRSLQGFANVLDARASKDRASIPFDTTKWTFDEEIDDGFATTAPVGSFRPNAFGLYDMHGNVWEWCLDVYADYPLGALEDRAYEPGSGDRVLRGGSWFNVAASARSACRGHDAAGAKNGMLGFRPVRVVHLE